MMHGQQNFKYSPSNHAQNSH